METMISAHLRATMGGAICLLFIGCNSQSPPPAKPAVALTHVTPTPPTPPEAIDGKPAPSTPDILARKTSTYAQDLEALMAQRRAASAATTPSNENATPQAPSQDVSHALRESTQNPPTAPAATANPPANATPTRPPSEAIAEPSTASPNVRDEPAANQVASLAAPSTPPSSTAIPTDSAPPAQASPAEASSSDFQRTLKSRINDHPRDIAAQLDYQLMQFIHDRPVPDMRAMASLPQEDRELLTALLDGLSNFRAGVRADNNTLLSRKIAPLLDLADRLRAQSDLTIPTIALCKRVDGFGVYEPIDPPRFGAGREHPVIIYSEVANFDSHRNDKQLWETKLTISQVLYTESGLSVWPDKQDVKTITDLSRNRRHDFFLVKVIRLPASLTIGRYLLKVTITDQQANRVAEATLPIVITAQ